MSDWFTESVWKKAVNYGTAVIGLAMVSHIVLNNNSAKIIQEIADSQRRMIRVMVGEQMIIRRDVPRFTELLGSVDDETMTELFAGLTDADLDWVESMLGAS